MQLGNNVEVNEAKRLELNVREEDKVVHVIPVLLNSLLSIGKLANTDYISIVGKRENITNVATNSQVTVSRGAVLRGCKDGNLWRVTLVETCQTRILAPWYVQSHPH